MRTWQEIDEDYDRIAGKMDLLEIKLCEKVVMLHVLLEKRNLIHELLELDEEQGSPNLEWD